MTLTKRQLRAAARHARELAMECVNGTAPPMINFLRHAREGHCAIGWIEVRSGGVDLWTAIDAQTILADGNNYEHPELWTDTSQRWGSAPATDHAARQERLVFPFLHIADELDLAAIAAPKALP